MWAALRCFRLAQLRTVQPTFARQFEIQEFASDNGWFDLSFSALPQEKKAIGNIDVDKSYYLMVMEAKMLDLVPELLEKQNWHDSNAIARLVKKMRAQKPHWEPRFQRLADEVEDEVRIDKLAIDKVFRVVAELQESLAWTAP